MDKGMKTWLTRGGILALAAAVLWPGGTATVQAADSFRDTSNHWGKAAIIWAAGQGIVDGYEDGNFRPDELVSEPEFLAMLIRAFPEAGKARVTASAEAWYAGFYDFARKHNWPLAETVNANSYDRGDVAQLIAGVEGYRYDVDGAVRYLLNRGLSQGKTTATVEGYASADHLTRAEAVQFLKNAKTQGLVMKEDGPGALPASVNGEQQVRGVSLGDTEAYVLAKLGPPARKDLSKYGFEWYVYNKDLLNYTQIGIQNGSVVGLFTTGDDWQDGPRVRPAMLRSQVSRNLGAPLEVLTKGSLTLTLGENNFSTVYKQDKVYTTFYYDSLGSGAIDGIQFISEGVELSLKSFYGKSSDRLKAGYEQEIFDLSNAARAERGLSPFVWNEPVAQVSRQHSEDMIAGGYFDHINLQGQKPWDRAVAAGITYQEYGENIAAGLTDAFEAHYGWLNSKGHRVNMLGETKELGVGVAFGGEMSVYYTQNFFTAP